MEISTQAKINVLAGKIAGYRQAYYSHKIDAQVAQDIGGLEDVVKTAQENMRRTQAWITKLELVLVGLEDELKKAGEAA